MDIYKYMYWCMIEYMYKLYMLNLLSTLLNVQCIPYF